MIVMQEKIGQTVFTPAEAVEYLRVQRGIIFTVASLRNRRRRGQANAQHTAERMTIWTKEELDAIQPSKRTKRVTQDELSS